MLFVQSGSWVEEVYTVQGPRVVKVSYKRNPSGWGQRSERGEGREEVYKG